MLPLQFIHKAAAKIVGSSLKHLSDYNLSDSLQLNMLLGATQRVQGGFGGLCRSRTQNALLIIPKVAKQTHKIYIKIKVQYNLFSLTL